jgi:hypothetical protein
MICNALTLCITGNDLSIGWQSTRNVVRFDWSSTMNARRMVVKSLKDIIFEILHKIWRTLTFKGVELFYTKTVHAVWFKSIRTGVVAVFKKCILLVGKTLYPANTNKNWWKFGHLRANKDSVTQFSVVYPVVNYVRQCCEFVIWSDCFQ